jgi:hypothetical protein
VVSDYTKWPRLLVAGEPVTREQASDILIRTDNWHFCTNDQPWEDAVNTLGEEYGMPVHSIRASKPGDYLERWREIEARRERMGVLQLHYLRNSRIASSWIGGPHGWCDWDGRIGCSNYNIGKWPTEEAVTEDWQTIADAFPYLNLHAQLVADEGEGELLATWAVKDGKAALVEPAGLITDVTDDTAAMVFGLAYGMRTERGVSLERLREALEQVRATRGGSDA